MPDQFEGRGEKRECPGDTKVLRKKGPEQFEGPRGKKRVAGGGKGAEKTINSKAP